MADYGLAGRGRWMLALLPPTRRVYGKIAPDGHITEYPYPGSPGSSKVCVSGRTRRSGTRCLIRLGSRPHSPDGTHRADVALWSGTGVCRATWSLTLSPAGAMGRCGSASTASLLTGGDRYDSACVSEGLSLDTSPPLALRQKSRLIQTWALISSSPDRMARSGSPLARMRRESLGASRRVAASRPSRQAETPE